MSLIKAIKQQLGLSVTPANNFTWDASSNGGATPLKLTRGDAVDVMTVDAVGKVAFPQNAQTWQNVIGSRAFGTTYTNSTGQTIYLHIVATISAGVSGNLTIVINALPITYGSTAYGYAMSTGSTLSIPIPNGSTYTVNQTSGLTVTHWMELR